MGGPTGADRSLVVLPELEVKLDLLGSRYNADLTSDMMEAF
jgi:hypothetical protein